MKPVHVIPVLLLGVALGALACFGMSAGRTHAANMLQVRDCGARPNPTSDLVVAYLLCRADNAEVLARQALAQSGDTARRVDVFTSQRVITAQEAADIAWSKAGDRIAVWQADSATYRNRWFYDQLFLRWKTHACREGVVIRSACP